MTIRSKSHDLLITGGWVGYFSYDTVPYAEKRKLPLSKAPVDDRNLPDMHLGLYDDVVVFDHVEKVSKNLLNFFIKELATLYN